ncbi:hypothetical protein KCU85_g90, partial [Aureobasidium melanogenum]
MSDFFPLSPVSKWDSLFARNYMPLQNGNMLDRENHMQRLREIVAQPVARAKQSQFLTGTARALLKASGRR